MKIKLINPYETNPQNEESEGKYLTRNILDTRGLQAQNRKKVGLLEMAKIPLKKRRRKLKKGKTEEQHEEVKAYVLTNEERLIVYRRKGSRDEDYASWPVMLEAKIDRWETQLIKFNLGEEMKEKAFMNTIKKEEKSDVESTEEKGTCRAVLKLGLSAETMG